MKRIVPLLIIVSTCVAPGVASPSVPTVRLYATVGAEHAITFKAGTANGYVPIASLRAGRYAVVVRDYSKSDNFHLFGPGLDKKTTRSFVGRVEWVAQFRKGTYTFRSDAHPVKTRRTVRVL